MKKRHEEIFKDVLEYYKDKEYEGADTEVEKLKKALESVRDYRHTDIRSQAYRLAEVGEFLVSNYDMMIFLRENGYKKVNLNNAFKKYCSVIASY